MRPCSNSLHWQAADAADEVPCLGNFTVHGKELWSTLSFHFFSGNLDGSFVELALHLSWDHLILYMEPDVIMGTESNITCNARYPINYNVLTIPFTEFVSLSNEWYCFVDIQITVFWPPGETWSFPWATWSWANDLWNKTITTMATLQGTNTYPPKKWHFESMIFRTSRLVGYVDSLEGTCDGLNKISGFRVRAPMLNLSCNIG